MISTRQADRRVAERVLRRMAQTDRCSPTVNAHVVVGVPVRRRVAYTGPRTFSGAGVEWACNHPWRLEVTPELYNAALWGAALGRAYATALRRYDRGHPPPLGTWEERLVARDRVEATTAVALREAAA